MSTDSSHNPASQAQSSPTDRRFTVGPAARSGHEDSPPIDRKLIQETRDQIRTMVDEITQLSQSNCSRAEFYQGFLSRTTSALASVGGAIWSVKEDGSLGLEYQINLRESGLVDDQEAQIAHGKLMQQMVSKGQPELIQPNSGGNEEENEETAISNPTEHLLVVGPLTVEQKTVGLVEIFQRPGAGPTTQRGYLRFLVQMCKVASDYLKNEQLRQYSDQQSTWNRMQSFVRSVHSSLRTRDTVYAIANEGRRVIGCDRVSVAMKVGTRMQVQTMSGLDTIERRADQIKRLSKLATTVARAGQPMWYTGDDSHLPPQIEKQLHYYLDISHSKLVVVQPIYETLPVDPEEPADDHAPQTGKIIGVIIAEQLADSQPVPQLKQYLEAISSHSNDAMTNSMAHSNMFLAPLWTWLGKTKAITSARNLPKTLIVVAGLAILAAVLCLVPYPFTLRANGKLIPENRSEVYANVDGVLKQIEVPKNPDGIVKQGDILAVMTNNDLLVQIQNLQGQFDKSTEEVNKLRRAQHGQELTPAELIMLTGELAEAEQIRDSALRQMELKHEQAKLLNVRAPATGNIYNWQLRQNLLRRPVTKGQNLMTIVHPDTPWQVELEFPERRVSHLMTTMRDAKEDTEVKVTFTLASHPGKEFEGTLVDIDNKLDVRSDEGNVVLVRVAFDSEQFPKDLLRSGTRVTAQVHSGQRSLGYVWFHEIIETAHSTWLLWF